MDTDKKLTIRIDLDKQPAIQASREFFESLQKQTQSSLASFEQAEKAKTSILAREARARIQASSSEIRATQIRLRDESREHANAAREKTKVSRDEAKEREQINRAVNSFLKQSARDEIALAKQTAREKKVELDLWSREWQAQAKARMRQEKDDADWLKQNFRDVMDRSKSAERGMVSFGGSISAAAAGFTALAIGKHVLSDMAQGAVDASHHLAAMTRELIELRDRGREVATIMGRDPDIKFTREQLEFAAETGQRPDEAQTFRSAFRGAAQQYADRFAVGQFEAFEVDAAKLATAKRVAPDQAARLSGITAGKLGQGATSRQALTMLAQAFEVLEGGSGEIPVLAGQLGEIAASAVGPGMQYKSLRDAAIAVRVQAEANPQEARTNVIGMRQGILDMTPEQRKRLGIDLTTPEEQIARILDARQRASGLTMDEFLKDTGFTDVRAARGWAIAINQGVRGGIYAAGNRTADQFNLGKYQSRVDRFFTDPSQPGMLRREEARTRLAESKLAEPGALAAPFLEQARQELTPWRANSLFEAGQRLAEWMTPSGWTAGLRGFEDLGQANEYGIAIRKAQDTARQRGLSVPEYSGTTRQSAEAYLSTIARGISELNDRMSKALNPPMDGRPQAPPARPGM